MEKLKVTYITLALAISVISTADASSEATDRSHRGDAEGKSMVTPSLLKMERINISHADTALRISFDINPKNVNPGSDRQVVFTPIVRNDEKTDSILLDPITVAGRNRYFSHLRKGDITAGKLIYKAGEKNMIEYTRYVPWADWMGKATVTMIEQTQDCCRPVKPLCETPLANISSIESNLTDVIGSIQYIPLTGDSTIELEEQGSAFIDFFVNRTEIKEDYRKNPQELKKIIESIKAIKEDPDAIITRLSIKGFASPEGSYDNNVRLAMGRTEALKDFVRKKYDFDPEILMTSYEAEDWDGLRNWLESCNLPHRDEIISLVESDLAPDLKDNAIKQRFPKEYQLLLDSVYPRLRHSDYKIRYRIRTFADIDEIKSVFNESPDRLRPVDFFRVAQTYPEGSEEFEEVLLLASDIHPLDQQAAINAANILLSRGEREKAAEKLAFAGESGEAYFSRGVLASLNEDFERAELFFSKALSLGVDRAGSKLDIVKGNRNREIITYQINVDNQ